MDKFVIAEFIANNQPVGFTAAIMLALVILAGLARILKSFTATADTRAAGASEEFDKMYLRLKNELELRVQWSDTERATCIGHIAEIQTKVKDLTEEVNKLKREEKTAHEENLRLREDNIKLRTEIGVLERKATDQAAHIQRLEEKVLALEAVTRPALYRGEEPKL